MAAKKKKASGGARIKGQGKSLVWVTLAEADKAKVRTAAGIEGLPMSQFLAAQGIAAAEKILEKFRNQA